MVSKVVMTVFALACMGEVGCARSSEMRAHDAFGVTMAQAGSVHVGAIRVVDEGVRPLAPVTVTLEGDVLAIGFAHPRTDAALARLDRDSLGSASVTEATGAPEPESTSAAGDVRTSLGAGRYIECSKQGNSEHGYRLVAEKVTADGTPVGEPTVVSPQGADVIATPTVLSLGPDRAVVAFVARSDERFELLAASLEVN